MACVTLKRSLEFEPLYQGNNNSCTPRPHKRRRLLPMCVTTNSSAASHSVFQCQPQSPFLEVTPKLTTEQIGQNVREQINRLKRRKMLQTEKYMDIDESPGSPTMTVPAGPSSPQSSNSYMSAPVTHHAKENRDKPLLSIEQVHMIAEQLVRENEMKLRELYDQVLNEKLSEQYSAFVRFTAEQITNRISQSDLPSYLS